LPPNLIKPVVYTSVSVNDAVALVKISYLSLPRL
jgi:hypothetical protein